MSCSPATTKSCSTTFAASWKLGSWADESEGPWDGPASPRTSALFASSDSDDPGAARPVDGPAAECARVGPEHHQGLREEDSRAPGRNLHREGVFLDLGEDRRVGSREVVHDYEDSSDEALGSELTPFSELIERLNFAQWFQGREDDKDPKNGEDEEEEEHVKLSKWADDEEEHVTMSKSAFRRRQRWAATKWKRMTRINSAKSVSILAVIQQLSSEVAPQSVRRPVSRPMAPPVSPHQRRSALAEKEERSSKSKETSHRATRTQPPRTADGCRT